MRKMIRNSLIGATASLALALPVALPAAMPGSVPVAAAAGQNMAEGAHGAEVSAVQVLLNRHDAGLEVDGHFGPKTTAAVVAAAVLSPNTPSTARASSWLWSASWAAWT